MQTPHIDWLNSFQFHCELYRSPEPGGVPLASWDVTSGVAHLGDESFVQAALADHIREDVESVVVRIEPRFQNGSVVSHVTTHLRAQSRDDVVEYSKDFKTGPWAREAQQRVLQLREEGTLGESEAAYQSLIALPGNPEDGCEPPSLQLPAIIDGTLDDFGVRQLGSGELVPDRPVLVNQRMVDDAIEACLASGATETGAATLGVMVRLPEPLPGTSTRIVTILTTCIEDSRHAGQLNQWSISPEALVETARIAEMRAMRESVITVTHTHGFNSECGNCNSNAACPLAECTHVSLMDYQVLETLFPHKSTLMPIAGRRMGAGGNRPVLEIHAWRGGQVRPIRWQPYLD